MFDPDTASKSQTDLKPTTLNMYGPSQSICERPFTREEPPFDEASVTGNSSVPRPPFAVTPNPICEWLLPSMTRDGCRPWATGRVFRKPTIEDRWNVFSGAKPASTATRDAGGARVQLVGEPFEPRRLKTAAVSASAAFFNARRFSSSVRTRIR
jgi:hypothetical protein